MCLFSWLAEALPPVFPGKDLDRLTGNVLRWRTIQNRRCRREIPAECFAKISPKKILIVRDRFVAWLCVEEQSKAESGAIFVNPNTTTGEAKNV